MLETIGSRLNVNIPRCTLAVLGQVWSMQNGKKKKNVLLVWIEFAGFQKLHWLNSSNIYQADFNSQSSRVTNLCSKWLAGQNFGDLNRKQWIKCFYLWHVKFFIVQCMYSIPFSKVIIPLQKWQYTVKEDEDKIKGIKHSSKSYRYLLPSPQRQAPSSVLIHYVNGT